MAWFYLISAGACEIVWAVLLKASDGFKRPWPSIGAGVFILVSLILLTLALKKLPLGTGYAVWTGIGAVGTVIWGIIVHGESRDPGRLACLALILIGIVGLKMLTPVE